MTDSRPDTAAKGDIIRYPCPWCGAAADEVDGCSGCGRPADPDAVNIVRLDARIAECAVQVQQARQAFDRASGHLADAQARRTAAYFRLRFRVRPVTAQAPSPETGAAPPAAGRGAGPAPEQARPEVGTATPDAQHTKAETSPRTVQTILFVLGGILLGSAAVVFTTVAWSSSGIAGKAVILAGFTVLALGIPPVALNRRLRGTAETFATLGLLLLPLDGYAAWHVNLAGLADTLNPGMYASGVSVVSAVVAAGYGIACRGLAAPRLVAVVVAQPALPLLALAQNAAAAGWSVLLTILAALNVGLSWLAGVDRSPAGRARRILAGVLAGTWLLAATGTGLVALLVATDLAGAAGAAGAVLAATAVLLGTALLLRTTPLPEITMACGVGLVAIAAYRTSTEAWPELDIL
ncbi:MAG: hypothetical protein KJO75_05130, partial [Dactylosporangium sp.]|nr:hypothetical protein [Dactylosporangium sp.]